MKERFNNLKKIFNKKNNIILLLISIIVSFFASISLISCDVNANTRYADYQDFPECFSYLHGIGDDYENVLDSDFYGLNKTKFYILSNGNIETNFNFEGKRVVLIGVEENFTDYPLLYQNKIASKIVLEKQAIESGCSFSKSDITGKTKTLMMNSCFLNSSGYNGSDIIIDGIKFQLIGSLNTTRMLNVYQDSSDTLVPIYMPYTTLLEMYPDDQYNYNLGWTIETKGLRFQKYENDARNLTSKYMYDEMREEYKNNLFSTCMIVILSLFILSILATFIIQFILTKNKHYEIGIKRAIGAHKSDLVYEYQLNYTIVGICGILLGNILSILIVYLVSIPKIILNNINIVSMNFNLLIIVSCIYFTLSFIASLVSLCLGVNVNIASIIVEER